MAKSPTQKGADELYRAALRCEESRRTAFLEEACAGDAALLHAVKLRLSRDQSAEDLPQTRVSEDAARGPGPEDTSWSTWGSRQPGEVTPPHGVPGVGRRLSHYEILSRLGSGGMGDVYRARDLTLGRDVAIKVMQQASSSEPERLRRFEREARAAAALSHPSIATIYEVGEHEGTRFISMELVEGETLRSRLEKGRLSMDEVLRLATQIAGGLAKAHEAGVVHRDLKPRNLMITTDGLAKILDFGLVKLMPHAPTVSGEITEEGSVLGTVEYMSPEQALARPLDHRSDQFSFGSILYEMATGRRPFKREARAQTLVAILQDEPEPIRKLNAAAPPELWTIVRRCLAKKPEHRYGSTADLARDLARLSVEGVPARRPHPSRWLPGIRLAAVLALAIGLLYWAAPRLRAPEPPTTLLEVVPLTSYPGREAEPSLSPDGSQVAFVWNGPAQDNQDVYVKVIGSERPLRLTSDPALDGSPAWSPDGGRIAFLRDKPDGRSEVRLVPPTGGPERLLAEVGAAAEYGLSWSPDGRRLATVDRSSPGALLGVVLLDTETGAKEQLTAPASSSGRGDVWPAFSPDGRTLAFRRGIAPTANFLCVVPTNGGEPRQLVTVTAVTSPVAWTPDGDEIIFAALPFVEEGGRARPSTRSNTGSSPVLWRISAHGGAADQLVGSSSAQGVAASRRGHRLVYTQEMSEWEIWRLDLRRSGGERQTRLIASTRFDGNPQFSPDGERVAFTSARTGGLEIWVADDEGEDLLRLTSLARAGSVGSPRWSPDGKSICFDFLAEGKTNADVYVVSASGGPPRQVTTAEAADVRPCWSTDGRWIYFGSHRSGEWQVWKVAAGGEGETGAVQVTRAGGYAAIESTDGAYVYFSRRHSVPEDPENSIWRVPVGGGDEEEVIESLHSSDTNWDVTDEGIYFVDRRNATSSRVEWIVNLLRLDPRRVSEVMRLKHAPRLAGPAFTVSPDGRRALVSQMTQESDLMLVESFR
jgi:Tol biopolymer transport system component